MATRFIQQAQQELNPVYAQQEAAIKSQIPALQQLYQTLYQGLDAKQASETQNILESSAARGLTRSSIPVDLQTALGQSMLQARGQLGAQQAGELAKIRTQLGDLGLQRAQAIQSLADTLYQRDLKERQFQMEQQKMEREFQLKQQEIAASRAASRATQQGAPKALVSSIYNTLQSKKGRDGFVSPNTFRAAQQQWIQAGGSPSSFLETFGWAVNPVHQERFGGYY